MTRPMIWVDNARLRQLLEKAAKLPAYRLLNARISPYLTDIKLRENEVDTGDLILVDLVVEQGRIARLEHISQRDQAEFLVGEAACIELGGRIIMPAFVDCHTHLDKGHIIDRTRGADGSFACAITSIDHDRKTYWNGDDLRRRMDFALRCAYHYGTQAVRTHLDTNTADENVAWSVFDDLRQAWQGRLALQAACLMDIETARDDSTLEAIARLVAKAGGVLGAFVYMREDIDILLTRLFAVADSYGLDLDFHADETLDPASHLLLKIAENCLKNGYGGRVLVGHCCALSQQAADMVDKTLDKVAQAGLNIVSLPLCNLYLQDRRHDATTPRQRGVTLLHEMKARGIAVALGSDNTRDPFYAYGDLDMLEVYRLGTRILHLDHPVGDWPRSVTTTASKVMGLGEISITKGQIADFIIFEGRTWSELLSRAEDSRLVIRNGQLIKTQRPSYVELDCL